MVKIVSWMRIAVAPSFSAFMFNLCSFVIAAGIFVYGTLLLEPSPIISVNTVDIEPKDHVINRQSGETMSIVREINMRRSATLQIIRLWIDEGGGIAPTLDDYITLEAGRQVRTRIKITPPTVLNPGHYRYRVSLKWCNVINNCAITQLEDVEVIVEGYPPFSTDRGFQEHRF